MKQYKETNKEELQISVYMKPEIKELSYFDIIRGDSCTGLPDEEEQECDPDLFTE